MATPPRYSIRRAIPDEAPRLNGLTGRSALHWGYEPEFLDWEPEAITVTPEHITRSHAYALEEGGHIVGYYVLIGAPPVMALDKLFIEPDRIGHGCGTRLWRHAVELAGSLGASGITVASDPNAAPFYRAMGARWTHEEQTTRPGWALQMFRFEIAARDVPGPAAYRRIPSGSGVATRTIDRKSRGQWRPID